MPRSWSAFRKVRLDHGFVPFLDDIPCRCSQNLPEPPFQNSWRQRRRPIPYGSWPRASHTASRGPSNNSAPISSVRRAPVGGRQIPFDAGITCAVCDNCFYSFAVNRMLEVKSRLYNGKGGTNIHRNSPYFPVSAFRCPLAPTFGQFVAPPN